MATVGAFEAKTHFSRLLERVESGEEITITRRGEPVAKLVPADRAYRPEDTMAVFKRMRDRAQRSGLPRFDWAEWKQFVDAGRR